MILTMPTIALEKEIATEALELGPRVTLNDNITIKIQGPVQFRLETEPAQKIELDPIPDLEFIRAKWRKTYLTWPFYGGILVANTGDSFSAKKDMRILVTTDNTQGPRDFRNLL